eukprot:TRINITY_DN10007_c0_g1_i2.p1 TRINITY_DN10007_c0_g1~~TRINITY_DN10007_c0_g1_i2.p1  ORF type:complete len:1099 (+),score=416.85 TRINITY_DN10007_c0_g1_i2:34-3297(+)
MGRGDTSSMSFVLHVYNLPQNVKVEEIQKLTGCPVRFVHLCGSNEPFTKDIGFFVGDLNGQSEVRKVIKKLKDNYKDININRRNSNEGDRKSHKRGSVVVMVQCVLEPRLTMTDMECADVLAFFAQKAKEDLQLDVTNFKRAIGRQKRTNDRCNIVTIYVECPNDEVALNIIGRSSPTGYLTPLLDAVPFNINRGDSTYTFYVSTLQTSVKSKCYTSKGNGVPEDAGEGNVPPLMDKPTEEQVTLHFYHKDQEIWSREVRGDEVMKIIRSDLAVTMGVPPEHITFLNGTKEVHINKMVSDFPFFETEGIVHVKVRMLLTESSRKPPPPALQSARQERKAISDALVPFAESTKPLVLVGPTGSGKNSIVTDLLATTYKGSKVHYIPASSPESIYASLLAVFMQGCTAQPFKEDPREKLYEIKEPKDLMETIYQMIDKNLTSHVFVYANVKNQNDLWPLIETRRKAQIIITTEVKDLLPEGAVNVVAVDGFASSEAVGYIETCVSNATLQDATVLLTSLKGDDSKCMMPYHIEAAMILHRSTGVEFSRFAVKDWDPTSIFVSRMKSLPHLSIDILCYVSCLSYQLVHLWMVQLHFSGVDEKQIRSALSACENMGLLAVCDEDDDTVVMMHPCSAGMLQTVLQTMDDEERGFTTGVTMGGVLGTLDSAMPDITHNDEFWVDAVRLLPHVAEVLTNLPEPGSAPTDDPKWKLAELSLRSKAASCLDLILKDHKTALEHLLAVESLVPDSDLPLMLSNKSKIGTALTQEHRDEEALVYYKEILQITKEQAKEGIDNQEDIAKALCNVGDCYFRLGAQDEARPYIEEAKQIFESLNVENDSYGRCLLTLGRLNDDKDDLEEARRILKGKSGRNSNEVIEATIELGIHASKNKEYKKAAEHLETAVKHCKTVFKAPCEQWANCVYYLAEAKQALSDFISALEYYEEALRLRKRLHTNANHPSVFKVKLSMGLCFQKKGEKNKAVEYLKDALKSMTPEQHSQDIIRTMSSIAMIFQDQRNPEEAARYLQDAEKLCSQYNGRSSQHASLLHKLGAVSKECDNMKEALRCMEAALDMRRSLYGKDSRNAEISNTLMC